jgi:ferredoxin-NADP reductase
MECYAETGASGETVAGRIDLARTVELAGNGQTATYYLCGPQAMIAAFCDRLTKEHGVPAENVRIDAWE